MVPNGNKHINDNNPYKINKYKTIKCKYYQLGICKYN